MDRLEFEKHAVFLIYWKGAARKCVNPVQLITEKTDEKISSKQCG